MPDEQQTGAAASAYAADAAAFDLYPDSAGNLDFIDGYLYRVMRELLQGQDADSTGLYGYYIRRIEVLRRALSWYDRRLYEYIDSQFDRGSRKIVHVGVGVGTLAAALAIGGFVTAGIERDGRRFAAADRVRAAVIETWPAAAERYTLIRGGFPAGIAGTTWISPETVLVFTNSVAGWSDELTREILDCFPSYGDVLFELRQFGRLREADEREALLAAMRERGLVTAAVPEMPANSYFFHARPCPPVNPAPARG